MGTSFAQAHATPQARAAQGQSLFVNFMSKRAASGGALASILDA
jgi:hypothetical protein